MKKGYHVLPLSKGSITYEEKKQVKSGDFIGITILDPLDPTNFS